MSIDNDDSKLSVSQVLKCGMIDTPSIHCDLGLYAVLGW